METKKESIYVEDINIREISAIAEETNKIGKEVLSMIEKQDEQINKTRNNIENSEGLHRLSNWILRSMTWSGWFYNLFTRTPIIKQNHMDNDNKIKEQIDSININNQQNKQKEQIEQREKEYIAYNSMAFKKELIKIEKSLKNIQITGTKIGEKLDEQNKKLHETTIKNDNLNEKIKKTNNKIISWL